MVISSWHIPWWRSQRHSLAGGVAEVIEHLLNRCEALSSNPSTRVLPEGEEEKRERERDRERGRGFPETLQSNEKKCIPLPSNDTPLNYDLIRDIGMATVDVT
jgi:hypothetical protein